MDNKVTIAGVIVSNFMLDHNYCSERFYRFSLSVKRSSGTVDTIPVIVSERLMDVTKDMTGQYVFITGEFRSFKFHENNKSRLLLYVFPLKVELIDTPEDINEVIIQGVICKEPVFRETPYGRIITDVLLTVTRGYEKWDSIPAIAWGRNAIFLSNLSAGHEIRVAGRVQSRLYNKNGITKTAYELSINLVEVVS